MATDSSFDSSIHHITADDNKNPATSTTTAKGPTTSEPISQAAHPSPTPELPKQSALNPPIKRLSDPERITLINAIGGYTMNQPLDLNTNPDPEKGSSSKYVYPPYATSAKNLPDGLLKTVMHTRLRAKQRYLATSFFYNSFIVLQLLLGATMTALAPSSHKSIAITILAALNTVTAGAIALLHNSGLPYRLQNDFNAYTKVENYLMEVMNSGIVPVDYSVNDAVAKCWDMFVQAKTTVENNKPANYVDAASTGKATVGGVVQLPPLQAGGS